MEIRTSFKFIIYRIQYPLIDVMYSIIIIAATKIMFGVAFIEILLLLTLRTKTKQKIIVVDLFD